MQENTGHHDTANELPAILPDLALDPARYWAELDSFDMDDARKHELLETLLSIMRLFVELGFAVDVGTRTLGQIFSDAAQMEEE